MGNSQRRSILCPNCRRLISLDEDRCPYCGISRPGSVLKNNFWTRALNRPEQLIKAVIYLNIGMYALALFYIPSKSSLSVGLFTFLSPDFKSLLYLGATGTIPIDQSGRWWSLLSASYLHAGILHIFFNMVAFRQLAPLVIQEFGTYRTVVIYTVGGTVGFFVSYLAGVRFTVGASAAVCALIGASLYFGKSRGGTYGQMIYKQIGGWALMIFLFGFLVPNINNWGHGGGLVAGVLLGYLLGYRERSPERLPHKTLAGICAGLTVCVLAWAVFSALFYRLLA